MNLGKIELLSFLLLPDFPSGSSITYHNDKLFLIGDDARDILVLDNQYKILQTIPVFEYLPKRIPKPEKADFESSMVVTIEGKENLLVLGSASTEQRKKGILVEMESKSLLSQQYSFTEIDLSPFVRQLQLLNLGEINLEGGTMIGNVLVLSNRANGGNPDNTFILTSNLFWTKTDAAISILKLHLSDHGNALIGVSELCYYAPLDLLLLTLSTEQTANAYDDGVIGDSYLGWINCFSRKMHGTVELNGMLNLSHCDALFKGEKIEGLCVERMAGNELILHLVSDNDCGQSKLFRVKIIY